METALFYVQRIGRPWVEHGCAIELAWAFSQADVELTPEEFPPLGDCYMLTDHEPKWIKLGMSPLDANQLLDVIVTRPGGDSAEGQLHCWTCVDQRARMVLTADHVRGTGAYDVRVIPSERVVGVYRLKRLTEEGSEVPSWL